MLCDATEKSRRSRSNNLQHAPRPQFRSEFCRLQIRNEKRFYARMARTAICARTLTPTTVEIARAEDCLLGKAGENRNDNQSEIVEKHSRRF
jgi:hypothetical protein